MQRKYIYPLLMVIVTVVLYYMNQNVDQANAPYPDISDSDGFLEPSVEFGDAMLPSSTTGAIVAHASYTLSYSEPHEQAEWVAYELQPKHIKRNDFKRPYFIEDRDVKTKSADWRNYKKSGYDRGHLCPAGDRGFDYDAYFETFLTSNISPQNHDFNAGIWNSLEQKVRYWAGRYDGVYVITGGILKNGLKTIGEERVSVPDEFYKIVIDKSKGRYKVAAFIIPNKPTDDSFYEYVTSVDIIESKTGIDFFPALDDAIENKMEASSDLKFWE
ncbi:endonuclease [Patiriisocius marinistellae]|uniref:Endonuclease n=1 Tax=Patiriisocius marinistellae TaxID=2494560 RepID=A0A5J4FU95_9FLAO|nr:DNA/RNA non-specific endonuclease [Patiriisocius marinistellae]GEQ85390.1 endonuclease [Patiriisocius marinistellae]